MEARLFDPQSPPDWLDSEWWVDQPHVSHIDNWVHKARLKSAAEAACNLVVEHCLSDDDHTICDIGSCDGGLLELIGPEYFAFGYDVIHSSIDYGRNVRKVDLRWGNVVKDKSLPLAPVVVCTEMLEHLEDPHQFLWDLKQRNVQYAVFSSPHSETKDHHEWNHAWAWDREGYGQMIEGSGWEILSHVDVEWSQQIVAKNG
jgi:2-polyprenyl-3-methyl-5-hydroxy-6-metoxy-1,4-benzoquinol methylase